MWSWAKCGQVLRRRWKADDNVGEKSRLKLQRRTFLFKSYHQVALSHCSRSTVCFHHDYLMAFSLKLLDTKLDLSRAKHEKIINCRRAAQVDYLLLFVISRSVKSVLSQSHYLLCLFFFRCAPSTSPIIHNNSILIRVIKRESLSTISASPPVIYRAQFCNVCAKNLSARGFYSSAGIDSITNDWNQLLSELKCFEWILHDPFNNEFE